jgi:hypothetical protein
LPLTSYQAEVARLLSVQRTPDSYLAGGAALHLEPNTLRFSNDLGYFNDSPTRVASAFDADRLALSAAGYEVTTLLERPGFVRSIVSRGEQSTKVEWVYDTAFRFLPVLEDPLVGYVLHPIDLAINKVLALVGRDEPRDYLDTIDAHGRILGLGGIIWAACGKDPGFTPLLLLDLLRRKGRYRPEDFSRLALRTPPDLPALKQAWLGALESASDFVASRPIEEIGCLYYSPLGHRFLGVLPLPQDATPHFGRPGGLLPLVGDP